MVIIYFKIVLISSYIDTRLPLVRTHFANFSRKTGTASGQTCSIDMKTKAIVPTVSTLFITFITIWSFFAICKYFFFYKFYSSIYLSNLLKLWCTGTLSEKFFIDWYINVITNKTLTSFTQFSLKAGIAASFTHSV